LSDSPTAALGAPAIAFTHALMTAFRDDPAWRSDLSNLIQERVALAREGNNPYVIHRLPSGWVVIGDVQPLPGYCLLLADPVVPSLNDLAEPDRLRYSSDMIRIGDALLECTSAYRVNYETWGNREPALHTHITPRYLEEPDEARLHPACVSYSRAAARPFDPAIDAAFMEKMRAILARCDGA
jgi:diadenosine tetraphosphate (Ap4A) HIT family hydrolase